MSQARIQAQPPETVSVTGLIADGVNLALTHLSLLLVPLLLDLYYLVGWKVTLGPLVARLESRAADLDGDRRDQVMRAIDEAGSWDITGLLSIFVPSFLAGADRDSLYLPIDRSSVAIESALVGVFAVAFLLIAGCLLYALFGQWLADVALGRERSWSERITAAPRVTVRILALVGLVIGVFLLVLGPLGLIWAGALAIGVDIQALLLPFVVLLVLAILALFYFAPEALMVANVGAPEAMRLSAGVVRGNVGTALMFAGASIIISIGLAEVFDRFATNTPGLLIALLGHAFVGSALGLAAMLYFAHYWQEPAPAST